MLGEIPLVAFGTNARRRLIGDPRSRLVLANMKSMWFRFAGRSVEAFQALPPIRSTVFMTLRKRINQNWDQVLLLILCAVMGGCQGRRNPATAAIEFTKIPPAAQGGRERVDTVAGRVVGARAGQQIVVYARSGPWWVQPWPDKPLIPIQSDSRCEGWQPATFASAKEFLACPRSLVPCCLVLGVSLPGLNALDLQKRVAVERTDMPIIFVTGLLDVRVAVQAMKAGAVECLTKPFREEVLLSAIRQALERSRVALGLQQRMKVIWDRYASLTRRERQVMALVVSGLLNKQVGGELGISEKTVKAHRGKVMQKMKAGSFADLVNMAMTLRLDDITAPHTGAVC